MVNNVVIISDEHVGCSLGLCTPDGAERDEGGRYECSSLQLKLWERWQYFWDVWVPIVTRGEPFAVIQNGDAIDGIHHNSVTQWTHNLGDQIKAAEAILKDVVERCEGRFYFNRGTEAHVGKSAQFEEMLARNLKAVADERGKYSRWILRIRVGSALIHATHHVGVSSSLAYETSALQRALQNEFTEAARWEREMPDVIVRSHRHRNCEVRVRFKKTNPAMQKQMMGTRFCTCFTTAGWQLDTPFGWRMSNQMPQIGGSMVRCGDEDVYARHMVWDIDLPKIVEM